MLSWFGPKTGQVNLLGFWLALPGAGVEEVKMIITLVRIVTTCTVCSSTMHWVRDCPHSYENADARKSDDKEDSSSKVNFSGFVGCTDVEEGNKLKMFSSELFGCALLDSGCANTVCGESWMANYLENLSDLERSEVREQPSSQSFTFGDGKSVLAKRKFTFPCYIGGVKGELTSHEIECEIPLLLSIKSMKTLNMKIDFKHDTLYFCGRQIKVSQIKSGHYVLPLSL